MSTLLTVEELARLLSIKDNTVRSLARKNLLPTIKIGNNWRFNKQNIAQWLLTLRNSHPSDSNIDIGDGCVSLMTIDEVANIMKLSAATVRNMARQNAIPGYKITRLWRFSKDEIEALLAS